MLDITLSPSASQLDWQTADDTATLPCSVEEFLTDDREGLLGDSRRHHQRLDFRGRAILWHQGRKSGVYTLDLSPNGIAFYSPHQLFPKEQVKLTFEQGERLVLEIARCRRIRHNCYRCGGYFAYGPMTPVQYRDFLRLLEA